jgi:hypothetical protein
MSERHRLPSQSEPGLDVHEWETVWQQLQDAIADAPDEALPEVVRFIGQLLAERGFQLDEPVTAGGADADVLYDFLAAREIVRAAEAGGADPEDVAAALADLQEIYDYVIADRGPP